MSIPQLNEDCVVGHSVDSSFLLLEIKAARTFFTLSSLKKKA
jgi:hypothetical protein